MINDFRLPFITAKDPQGQLKQMQSYMYQLVGDLNHAMTEVVKEQDRIAETQKQVISAVDSPQAIENTFTQIKELIIKSADIVEAYAEQISAMLSAEYLAKSDFGDYWNQLQAQLSAMADGIDLIFTDVQQLTTHVQTGDSSTTIVNTNAYIRAGRLVDSVPPVYGIEVGQTSTQDGTPAFDKYARFTPSGIYFYLEGDVPVASFENQTMHISYAQIDMGMVLGGYIVDATNGIAFKWSR